MPTEYLEQKITNLKSQIMNLDTTRYLQTLVVKDAEAKTDSEQADTRLRDAAREAVVQITVLTRQLSVRADELAALEAEQAALTGPAPK